jgi:hypothetical protein
MTTRRSKKQKPGVNWSWIGILLAIASLIGLGGYWLFSNYLAPPAGLKAIAKFLPQETQLVVAINSDLNSWQKLNTRLNPEAVKLVNRLVSQSPLQSLLSQSKTNFSQDIQPWLGSDAIVALIGDPQNPDNPPGTLILLPTANRTRSEEFLVKYRNALQAQGAVFAEQNYRGLNFFQSPTREVSQSLITANLDNKVVLLSNSRNLIQQAYDTYKGDRPSLAEKQIFSRAFLTQNPQSLVKLYLDKVAALQFLSNQGLEAITAEVKIQDRGLKIFLDSHLQQEQLGLNTSQRVLSFLPQNTFLLISGNNLLQSWQSIRDRTKSNPASDRLVSQWQADIKRNLDLDWEKDILAWLTGEFAIAAASNNQGVLKAPGFGLVALAQTNDLTATTKVLEKWSSLAKSGVLPFVPLGMEVKNTDRSGKSITAWQVASANSSTDLATQGFLEPDLAFWAMGNLGNTLLKPSKNLIDSNSFQALTKDLAKPSSGYFYLDFDQAKAIAIKVIPKELKATDNYTQTLALLDGIPGMAVSLSSPEAKILRLDFLINLKPGA